MQDFLKIQAWHKAHSLASDIHRLTLGMRGRDNAVLRGQLQRSSQATPDNLAEGAGKVSNAEFARYIDMSLGSASESHSQLITARERGLVTEEQFHDLADRITEVRKMLFGLLKRVRGSDNSPPAAPTRPPRRRRASPPPGPPPAD